MNKRLYVFYLTFCTALFVIAFICALQKSVYPNRNVMADDELSVNHAEIIMSSNAKSLVQIRTLNYLGSGVIYQITDKEIWILTVAHIFSEKDNVCIVTFSDGYQAVSTQCQLAKDADLAFVRLCFEEDEKNNRQEKMIDHLAACEEVPRNDCAFENMKPGDAVVALGSVEDVAENAYEGKIQSKYIYVEDFEQYMIVADVYATQGMSGGALFNLEGELLGIIAGIHDEEQKCLTAVIPSTTIVSKEYFME